MTSTLGRELSGGKKGALLLLLLLPLPLVPPEPAQYDDRPAGVLEMQAYCDGLSSPRMPRL